MARKLAETARPSNTSELQRVERSVRAALAPELHARQPHAVKAVVGGTPMCEHQLPGCIQEMLADYRRAEAGLE